MCSRRRTGHSTDRRQRRRRNDRGTGACILGDEAVVEFVAMDSAIGESRYRVVPDTDYVEMYTQIVDQQTYPMGALVTEHGRCPL